MIDPILATDDKNGDGYIDYKEFVLAQQAAATQKDVWNPFFPQKNPSKILKKIPNDPELLQNPKKTLTQARLNVLLLCCFAFSYYRFFPDFIFWFFTRV